MISPCHITLKVEYERRPEHGRSLAWIAPELKDAGLRLTDDRLHGRVPSRTWKGIVDGPTFARFARAWRLPTENCRSTPPVPDTKAHADSHTYTLDGLNWESGGISPIVYASVEVRQSRAAEPPGRLPAHRAQPLRTRDGR